MDVNWQQIGNISPKYT